jgi:hypothetical protein
MSRHSKGISMDSIVDVISNTLKQALNDFEILKKTGGLTSIYEFGDSNERSVPLRCTIKSAFNGLDGVAGFSVQYEPYFTNAPKSNSRLYLVNNNLPNVRFKLLSYRGRVSSYYLKQPKLKRSLEQLSLFSPEFKSDVHAIIFIHCNKEDADSFFFWSLDEKGQKYKLTDEQSFDSLVQQLNTPAIELPELVDISSRLKEII